MCFIWKKQAKVRIVTITPQIMFFLKVNLANQALLFLTAHMVFFPITKRHEKRTKVRTPKNLSPS